MSSRFSKFIERTIDPFSLEVVDSHLTKLFVVIFVVEGKKLREDGKFLKIGTTNEVEVRRPGSKTILLIQHPRSVDYIGTKGAFTRDGTIGFTRRILRAAKVRLALFISYERSRVPRYTGCTGAGQFREYERRISLNCQNVGREATKRNSATKDE